MFNKIFWEDALIRAVRTFAQTAVALLGVSTVGFADVDWLTIISAAGVAAVISILTSIGRIQSPLEASVSQSDATTEPEQATIEDEAPEALEADFSGDSNTIQPPKKLG